MQQNLLTVKRTIARKVLHRVDPEACLPKFPGAWPPQPWDRALTCTRAYRFTSVDKAIDI